MKKKSKGFTLIEVIITLAILTVTISLAAQMITFSMKSQKSAEKEFDFQSQMRLTSQTLNNEIRKATVLFAIPQETFESKKPDWNYLGLEDSKTLVSYVWNPVTNNHDRRILIDSQDDKSFNLYFKKNNSNSNMLEFNLQGYTDNAADSRMSVKTELEALNSLVVEDGGTTSYPATAIAYRTDSTPQPETKEGKKVALAITLVLDKSGSMKDKMGGREKIAILNEEVRKLIDNFKGMENVYISIVAFSDNANNPKAMKAASEIVYTDLPQGGGTNTGDGLRRGYYTLKHINDNKAAFNVVDKKLVSNIILLTDGDPTRYTFTGSNVFYSGDANVTGSVKAATVESTAMNYIEYISSQLVTSSTFNVNSYLIGFGTSTSQNNKLKKINKFLTKSGFEENPVYTPNSDIELKEAFDDISQTILKEVWHIYGPY